MEFMYLVFTRMPGVSYRRRLGSLLLCLFGVFLVLIDSRMCCMLLLHEYNYYKEIQLKNQFNFKHLQSSIDDASRVARS